MAFLVDLFKNHNQEKKFGKLFWFLRDTGNDYFYSENFEKAIKFFNDALKICPFDIETLNQLGEAYLERGEYELARALFEKAIKIPSSDDILSKIYKRDAMYNLGISYNKLYLFNKAITACNKAMDLDEDLVYARDHVNTWGQIAIAYEGMGDFKRAKDAQKIFKKTENKMKPNLGRKRIRLLLLKIRRIK